MERDRPSGQELAGAPELSVVVVVGDRVDRAVRCVASLRGQGLGNRLEVVLVRLGEEASAPPFPGADDPAVVTVWLPRGTTFSQARARAVGLARAPLVAFLEEHCLALPGWAEGLLEAFRGPWAGVGGEFHLENPGQGRADLSGLVSYGIFYPPLARGETTMLPGHNAAYRTEVLRRYGDDLAGLLRCDLVFQQRLCDDGFRLLLEPAVRFAHRNEVRVRTFARGTYLYNRIYGALRASILRWPLWRRLAYAVLTPIVPLYAYVKLRRTLARTRPHLLPLLQASLPGFLFTQLAAAAGQAAGLVLGEGAAEAGFTEYELSAERELR